MANEFQFWSGKADWCFVDRLDNFGRYSVRLYPDTNAYNEIMKLKQEGLQNVIKKDDNGYYLNVSRPPEIKMRNGATIALSAPELLDADGKTPIRGTMIGNGSDVTIKVEIRRYKTLQKKDALSARMVSVRVDNLVPVEPKRDFPPALAKAVAGLDTAPRSEMPF